VEKSKVALITGITGQDAAYLAEFLLKKKYKVYGTFRRTSTPNFWRLNHLGIEDKINFIPADLIDNPSLVDAVKTSNPDEVYHLAAQSYVGSSFDQPISSGEFTGLGVTRILEAIRLINSEIKFYQASSSEIYGMTNGTQNEDTAFKPRSPYAASKLYGFWMTKMYREAYGMFATNGILFNHESPLRGLEFVTRKISNAVARIKLGLQTELKLGNLNAKRDWGYAEEYVEGMWKIMQQKKPDDFVLSTDESHSVKEFVEAAFDHVNLKWKKYVKTEKKFYRMLEVDELTGDSSKARKNLKWNPRIKFSELVRIMVDADLDRWSRWQKGEKFAWDAPNYPNEEKTLFRIPR
jgi:GDPmannose 4,6-dehydratase